MDFLENMNRALTYIETHLTEKIDYKELAASALCSISNFQRFFTYMANISLSEYIRRRRLSCAALELQQTSIKVIDLAIKYGYQSSVSFSRAFQLMHGVSPSQARKGAAVKSYPRLILQFSLSGEEPLNYKIIKKPDFHIIGIRETIRKNGNNDMSAFWRSRYEQAQQLNALTPDSAGIYGVTLNYTANAFDYLIAVLRDCAPPPGTEKIKIPSSHWAIFQCIGALPDVQYKTWHHIFTQWLPTSGYLPADLPQLEWYPPGDISSDKYESQIWLPLQDIKRME